MEKKKYITPECEIVEMETVNMIANSFDKPIEGTEEDENDSGSVGSNRHRGEWGNLWSDWGEK